MFLYELKKLLIKQHGLIFALFCLIAEVCMLIPLYGNSSFPNTASEEYFNSYMQIMGGRLTDNKTDYILSEHEKLLTAQSELKLLQDKLISGELTDDEEYLSEYMKLEPNLKRADAFYIIFDKYKYACKEPDKRFIMQDCNGISRDYPDIPILLFVAVMTSIYFLSEESSAMIVLIRSYSNRKNNIFTVKMSVIFLTVILIGTIASLCEFVLLYKCIGKEAMYFPIQSIGYFSGCGYNVSIIGAYILISLIRMTGYVFIISLTVLLSVTIKKAIPVTALPLTLSLIQQFIFTSAEKAYYIPTGLLRATGYFRGDTVNSDEGTKIFSSVGVDTLIFIILSVAILTAFTIAVGLKYYCGKRVNKIHRILPLCFIAAVVFTGCNNENKQFDQRFNMHNSVAFVQNEDYYFITEYDNKGGKLYAVSKNDNSRFPVIRTAFDENICPAGKCIVGNDMYFMESDGLKGFKIIKVDLNDFSTKEIAEQSGLIRYSFLGLEYNDTIVFDKYVLNFFTDGTKLFLITSDYEVYSCGFDLKNPVCIISDGIFNANLIWDGDSVWYINNTLELKMLNPYTGESKKAADGFVKSFDITCNEIVYSNKDGVFKTNKSGTLVTKLSDKKATDISIDEKNVVFFSDKKLYCFKDNVEHLLYSGALVNFSCIDGCDKVICFKYDSETSNYVEFTKKLV